MNKIKVVKQRDLKDCGVCCLQAIIQYYDGYVPIEKLRLDTGTNVSGTNALNLIEASKSYGFDSLGVKVDDLFNEEIKLPAIAHVTTKEGLNHFVVIYKITKKNVYLMDPAKGKIVYKLDEFLLIWNHVLLEFYPKQKIIFMKKDNSLLKMFGHVLSKEKKLFKIIFLVSLILTLFSILNSYYFKMAMEGITKGQDGFYFKIVVITFAMFLFLKLVFTYIRKELGNHLNKNIDVVLLKEFLEHLFHLPLEVISSRTNGEVMTRVKELMNIKSLFTDIFVSFILDLSLMVISVPILYKMNNQLFLYLFVMIVLYLIWGLITSKIIYKMAYRNIELESKFNTVLLDTISVNHSMKNLFLTDFGLKKIENSLGMLINDNFHFYRVLNKDSFGKIGIIEIFLFVINTVGFWLILKGKLVITDLITFNTLAVYFVDPFKNVIDIWPKYLFLKASFAKINEFLNMEEETFGNDEILNHFDLKVDNLAYSYNHYKKVLEDISFALKEGEFTLLMGASGSGKSTLCKILEKNINDYEGSIKIGEINLKDLSIETVRKNITYVSQNENLFTGTIKENILFGRDVSLEEFERICKICQIEEIVSKKPLRYETLITNESSFISGGERQRIILARALLKNANIYLFDEALSEVDVKTETKIIKALQKELKGKSVLYISHKDLHQVIKKEILLEGISDV